MKLERVTGGEWSVITMKGKEICVLALQYLLQKVVIAMPKLLFSVGWLYLLCFAFNVGQWKRNATWWYSQYVWTRFDTTCKIPFPFDTIYCWHMDWNICLIMDIQCVHITLRIARINMFQLYNDIVILTYCENIYICVVLSGTKYGLKQTRGKFGLGAKMVMFDII